MLIQHRESVLTAIAFILLAGVILYNVIASPVLYPAKVNKTASGSLGDEPQTSSDTSTATTGEVPLTQSAASASASASGSASAGTAVNINEASAEELMTLKGIGETKAKAIVDYRNENGRFSSVQELTNVSGIGEKTLAKIIQDITV